MYTALSVLGSDVIYSEGAVGDLLDTLLQLCGTQTTIFLAGELRNGKSLSLTITIFSLCWIILRFSILFLVCRFCSGVLSRSCNERFCDWPCGTDTVASRLLQPSSCGVYPGEKVREMSFSTRAFFLLPMILFFLANKLMHLSGIKTVTTQNSFMCRKDAFRPEGSGLAAKRYANAS